MIGQVSRPIHERAIVVGGSMVGMAVARALEGFFREIVVIDRDHFPRGAPEHRRGVPQSWHIHNLVLRGQRELEELFPGFVAAALRLGAMQIDHTRDVARYTRLGWDQLFPSGIVALSATRILLEFAQRERFRALMKGATVLEGTRVEDLLVERRDGRLQAVGVVTNDPQRRTIGADLVIDCAGRSAPWKGWFRRHGAPLPEELVVDSRCGYSSRFYRPRNPKQLPWKAMVVDTEFPHQPHWGVIVPLENNDWVVTLGGFNGQYPPSDDAGFLTFARSLQTPLYARALEQADPLTSVRTFRRLEMRWNRFERTPAAIGRFLAIGDAAWAYNPLYGQGMAIGVTCARFLRDLLRESAELAELPGRYYKAAHKFAFPPWEAAALLDMQWPETVGKRPWHAKLSIPLGEFLLRIGHYDQDVCRAVLACVHLLNEPRDVLTPRVMAGVARYGLRWLTARLPPPQRHLPPAPRSPADGIVHPTPG